MAGAKSGVHVVQLKPLTVVKSLQDGNKFVKWDDDATIGTPVTLRVDKKGFFLYWTDQNNETEVLEVSSIRDARTGKGARTPKEGKLRDSVTMGPSDIPLEDKTVTVVYGSDLVNINFIHFCCNNREVAQEWTDELLKMAYNLLALNGASTNFLEKAYTKLCLSAERDKIPVKNIFKTFAQHKDDKKRVEKALEMCALPCGKGDMISPEKFDFSMFFTFYQNLTCRTEVEKIYESICGSGGKKKGMTTDQLVDFLNNTQRDPRLNEILYPYANHERAKDIIKQYEPNKSYQQRDTMSMDGFLRYLMSDDNTIVAPEKFDQNLDMDQPLSHYFINSSHNTYLTGHQLTGRSSVEIYRQCLLTGCRCVELDCWNGKNSDEEPIITHGYTVVTEILFKEVLEAIADCAFKTSPYPVILSFENHCSPKQQAKMAMYCRKIFGDMLLTEPLTSQPLKPNQNLPSPQLLLKKIIIKNKKKHFPRTQKSGGGDTSIDEDDDSSTCLPLTPERGKSDLPSVASAALSAAAVASASGEEDPVAVDPGGEVRVQDEGGGGEPPPIVLDPMDLPNGRAIGVAEAPDLEDSETESASDEEKVVEAAVEDQNEGTAAKESEAGAEMSALVNYIQPVRFHSFEHAEKRNRGYEISSFVETQATSLLKEYPVEFVNYNKRQLSRIYPKGMRTDSSNYMPQVFWNAGCQMVALNFQTLDLGMQLNLGIFEYNCRTGYLLKPDFMRRNDRKFDLFTESTVDGIIAGTVSVKILSGQFLSDKRVGTYIEVDMYGLPADTVKRRFKTKTVPANGINPIYDEEPFVFKKVVLPELACLRISVYEENGKFVGHRVLPVVGLRPGYRHIQLRNEAGQPLTLASLFVLITVKDYIPDGLSELADALANPIAYQSVVEKHAHQLACLTDDDDLEEKTDENRAKRHSQPGEGRKSEDRGTYPNVSRDSNVGDNSKMSSSMGVGGSSKPSSGNVNGSVHRTSTAGSTSPLPNTLNRQDTLSKGHNTSIKSIPDDNSQERQPSLLEAADIKAESLEKIREHKIVLKVLAKQEKDLLLVQKKHEKVREKEKELQQQREEKLLKARESKQMQLVKNTSKLAKKLPAAEVQLLKRRSEVDIQLMSVEHQAKLQELNQSHSQNLCALSQEHYRAAMELRQKYQEPLFNAMEKATQLSQTAQIECLKNLATREASELMKRLEAQTKEDMRNLSKKHKDKSEMDRVKRELNQKLIDQAVAERQKINTLLDKKIVELEKQHAEVRKRFEEERQEANKKIIAEYDELCEEAKVQYESQCNPNPITSGCEPNIPESTEL